MSTPNLSTTERIDVRVSSPVKQLLQEAAHACCVVTRCQS